MLLKGIVNISGIVHYRTFVTITISPRVSPRSEYFGSMFSSSWVESSDGGCLSLPLPSSLVQPLLDYLYKDEVVKLNKSDDPEFCSNLLVLADQFLMKRQKKLIFADLM